MLKIIDLVKKNITVNNEYIIKKIIKDSKKITDYRTLLEHVKNKYDSKVTNLSHHYSSNMIIKNEMVNIMLVFDETQKGGKTKFSEISYFIPVGDTSFTFSGKYNDTFKNDFVFRNNNKIMNIYDNHFINYLDREGLTEISIFDGIYKGAIKTEVVNFFIDNFKLDFEQIMDLSNLTHDPITNNSEKDNINLMLKNLVKLMKDLDSNSIQLNNQNKVKQQYQ